MQLSYYLLLRHYFYFLILLFAYPVHVLGEFVQVYSFVLQLQVVSYIKNSIYLYKVEYIQKSIYEQLVIIVKNFQQVLNQ
jgi:hypothetical protein